MTENKENGNSSNWSPSERETAINLRPHCTIREISEHLRRDGFNRSPKSVEKFFERIGLTVEGAKLKAGITTTPILDPLEEIYKQGPIQTSWGEPMLVKNKSIEFGQGTSVVPIMVIPDIHAPFHDEKAVELACKIVEIIKPVGIYYVGDNVDWCQISSFDRDPKRLTHAQVEVDAFHAVDRMFMSAAGSNVRRYWILGNHEDRLRKYHCKNPELSEFRGLQFDSILGLLPTMKPVPNLQLVDGEINWRDRFIIKHGKYVRKWSGWSAKAELETEHMNGISGHTHRAGKYPMTQRGRVQEWTEAGCLCSLTPNWMTNPNWQHAVNIGYFNGDGKTDFFHIDQIIFSKYQAIVNGNFLMVK